MNKTHSFKIAVVNWSGKLFLDGEVFPNFPRLAVLGVKPYTPFPPMSLSISKLLVCQHKHKDAIQQAILGTCRYWGPMGIQKTINSPQTLMHISMLGDFIEDRQTVFIYHIGWFLRFYTKHRSFGSTMPPWPGWIRHCQRGTMEWRRQPGGHHASRSGYPLVNHRKTYRKTIGKWRFNGI